MNNLFNRCMCMVLGGSIIMLSGITESSVNADTVNYVAFGDSISYGYGLENINDGFVYLVEDYLNTKVSNYAVNGLTSTELVEMLDTGEYDESIADADVITITIGSNDILLPFIDMIYTSFELEGDLTTALKDWYDNSSTLTQVTCLNRLKYTIDKDETLDASCENFKENTLPTIINDIKELNPDCEILVTEFYNPYYKINVNGMFALGDIVDEYIQKLNSALDASSEDYTIVPIYEDFNTTGLTNADIDTFNMDPHPNIEGHKVIAEAVIKNLKTSPAEIGQSDSFGDVNGDGSTDALDILLLKQHILGKVSKDTTSNLNLDVNEDSYINILDILALKKILL